MSLSSKVVSISVLGTAKVASQIEQRRRRFAKGIERGIKRAGVFLLGKSLAIVPVDQGPLRASGSVRAEGKGFKTVSRVGYGTEYALMVHEDLDARHGEAFNLHYAREIATKQIQPWNGKTFHKRGPNQQAKFLEKPARENRKQIVQIVIAEGQKNIT